MKYEFVARHQDKYAVSRMCGMLGISRSSYYAWRKRKPSQRKHHMQVMLGHIREIYKLSRKTYGSPRVHAELKRQGLACNQKTVARLMRLEGLQGQRKHRRVTTTDSNHCFPIAANLLNRDFTLTNLIRNGWPILLISPQQKGGYIWQECWICSRGKLLVGKCQIE